MRRPCWGLWLCGVLVVACSPSGVQPLESPDQVERKLVPSSVTASDYAPRLDVLALGFDDGTFEVRSPAPHHVLSRGKHRSGNLNLALSPDGTKLASLDKQGTLALSLVENGELAVLADVAGELELLPHEL